MRFTQGWRGEAGLWSGWPPSTTYFNFNVGEVVIFFAVPVKNITFTMYDFFPNTGRGWAATIKYSSLAFDPTPRTLSPSPILYYTPDFGGTTVNVPVENVRYLVINFGGQPFSIDDFSYETNSPTAPTYLLEFNISTDPAFPVVVGKTITAGTPINAKLSLGTVFSVGIVKRQPDPQGGPATITDVASAYSTSEGTIAPALETTVNLFPDSPMIPLSPLPSSAVTDLTYAAVHLGTVKFTLTPFDIGAPASVTLNLTIARPSALGGEHNDWDNAVIDAAHERGIPPQVIKGQIRQESPGFNQDEFRYEPCSSDFAEISRGATLIKKTPYNLYAMDGALGDPDFGSTRAAARVSRTMARTSLINGNTNISPSTQRRSSTEVERQIMRIFVFGIAVVLSCVPGVAITTDDIVASAYPAELSAIATQHHYADRREQAYANISVAGVSYIVAAYSNGHVGAVSLIDASANPSATKEVIRDHQTGTRPRVTALDLDNDGVAEAIVRFTLGPRGGAETWIYRIRAGHLVSIGPVNAKGSSLLGSPDLVDFEGRGVMDLVDSSNVGESRADPVIVKDHYTLRNGAFVAMEPLDFYEVFFRGRAAPVTVQETFAVPPGALQKPYRLTIINGGSCGGS